MKKIGLFYSPAKGSTEKTAQIVAESYGKENVDMILVTRETPVEKLLEYDNLIFGISTVGKDTYETTYSKSGWDWMINKIEESDFSGKTIALFGLGNHITYPAHFVDSMGLLGKTLQKKGAKLIGFCDAKDFEYEESKAVVDGKFIGLPVDLDNEDNSTNESIKNWVEAIKKDF